MFNTVIYQIKKELNSEELNIIFPGPMQAYRVVEFFAGDGNVGKTAKYGMVACAQLDVDYGKQTARVHKQNSFDLLQPSCLAFLGS